MKLYPALVFLFTVISIFSSCTESGRGLRFTTSTHNAKDSALSKQQIASMLDSFNVAAANADYDKYFDFFTPDAVFMGTDATEHWDKQAFMLWAKPQFDKKEAWNFRAVDRHIFLGKGGEIGWFDELLDAPFAKMCRGSGVVVKQGNEWKVQQYVLSMTVPNSLGNAIAKMKTPVEDSLLNQLKAKGQK